MSLSKDDLRQMAQRVVDHHARHGEPEGGAELVALDLARAYLALLAEIEEEQNTGTERRIGWDYWGNESLETVDLPRMDRVDYFAEGAAGHRGL